MGVDSFRLFQLASQGFCCSQIMLILGLADAGKPDNPDLIKAMDGLCGGLGRSGGICGALTGGICVLGLAAGKGTPDEYASPKFGKMINELLEWFDGEYPSRDCANIINTKLDEGAVYPVKCGNIVVETYTKVREILDRENEEEEELG